VSADGQAALSCWDQVRIAYPFHWLALWPLLAVAVGQDTLDDALGYARCLLDPSQQPRVLCWPPSWKTPSLPEKKAGRKQPTAIWRTQSNWPGRWTTSSPTKQGMALGLRTGDALSVPPDSISPLWHGTPSK
jgi:hypothetical protein